MLDKNKKINLAKNKNCVKSIKDSISDHKGLDLNSGDCRFMEAVNFKQIDWKTISKSHMAEEGGVCAYFTSGTTDKPKTFYYPKRDMDLMAEYLKWFCEVEGIAGGHRVLVFMDQFFWGVGYFTMLGHIAAGNAVIPVDTDLPKDVICKIVKASQPTVISSLPSVIVENIDVLKCDSIKIIETTGEKLDESSRKKIEDYFGVEIFDAYGLTEGLVGVECKAHDGYHFLPKFVGLEIIEPETGKILKNGKWGELVMTNFLRQTIPGIMRYKTGDICKISTKLCKCGIKSPKIWIKGRKDDEIELFEGFMLSRDLVANVFRDICGHVPPFKFKRKMIDNKYVLCIDVCGICDEDCDKIKKKIECLNYEMLHMINAGKLVVTIVNEK